jgi:hypothetical protein
MPVGTFVRPLYDIAAAVTLLTPVPFPVRLLAETLPKYPREPEIFPAKLVAVTEPVEFETFWTPMGTPVRLTQFTEVGRTPVRPEPSP